MSFFSAFDQFWGILGPFWWKKGTFSSFWPFRVNFDKNRSIVFAFDYFWAKIGQFFLLPPILGAFWVHFDKNGYILCFFDHFVSILTKKRSILSAFDHSWDIFWFILTKTVNFWPFRVNFDKTGQFSLFFLPSFGPFTLHFWRENRQTLHFWREIGKLCIFPH